MEFEELKNKILKHEAKSEYKQAAIVILRKIFEQSPETGQVDAIVIGEGVATASNVIRFLSDLTHGLASGKRDDLLKVDFQNAKDHFEILSEIIENRQ